LVTEAVRLVRRADSAGVTLRIVGGVAVRIHCPELAPMLESGGREMLDVDVVASGKQANQLTRVLEDAGYRSDVDVYLGSGGTRMLFEHTTDSIKIDVFLDSMEFCHTLPVRDRLRLEPLTMPAADLLLQKMQIIEINVKDLLDTAALLAEHPVVESDDDHAINGAYVAQLCAGDWGLWRTVSMNLRRVADGASDLRVLTDEQEATVVKRVDELLDLMERHDKSMKWRMRARIGDRVKWWNDVEEVERS
jgi:hypothetical protein